jgi:hypothetical protein
MPTDVISLRLDPELREWADGYAAQRKVSRTALLNAAVREFRELAARGVPELPAAKSSSPRGSEQASGRVGRPTGTGSAPVSGTGTGTAAGSAPAEDPRLARQRKLNEGKYGRS